MPAFLVRVVVEGESMSPALIPGDRLLVVRTRRVRRGDVVALLDPRERDRTIVKRVDRVEGDAVTVLGDNSGASTDSRCFGPVDRRELRGRAIYRYWPENRRGRLTR
ncbi:MAG: nickel-type superoxide dismutase maturation protease [Actinobacteria bacterium]|nr:MAG: nickel-type superoxide dismutase maturation protease [Actinomycetota bacterium]